MSIEIWSAEEKLIGTVTVIIAPIARTATRNKMHPVDFASCFTINQREVFRSGIHKTIAANTVERCFAVVGITIFIAVANRNSVLVVDIESENSIVRAAHKYFSFSIAIEIECCDINFHIHGDIRTYVDCPQKSTIEFVSLEICEIVAFGAPVFFQAFQNDFHFAIAIEVGSSGIVGQISVFTELFEVAQRNFQKVS